MQASDLHRQRFGTQTEPMARPAGAVVLIPFKFFANPGAVRLAIAALHIRDYTFEAARHLIDPTAFIIAEGDFHIARATQEHLLYLRRDVFPLGLGIEPVMIRDGLNRL